MNKKTKKKKEQKEPKKNFLENFHRIDFPRTLEWVCFIGFGEDGNLNNWESGILLS